MKVRPCFFIVHDDGSFYRLKQGSFYRLLQSRDDRIHPEFKGQRIKYAEIYIAYDGRRPVSVCRATFRHLTFDHTGRLDEHEDDKFDQLFVQLFPDLDELDKPHLANARAARVNAEIEREFGWQPTPELRDQLYDAALRNKLVGGTRH